MITVAVCTYRRFDRLSLCLESLQNQTVSNDNFTLLIIDNSLQPEISIKFKQSLSHISNLNYIITQKCGIAYARNKAVEHCKTEILAFTDDDCILPTNWVETILYSFNNLPNSVAAIGGKVSPLWQNQPPTWVRSKLLYSLAIIDWGEDTIFINHKTNWLLTANAAYRTSALKKTKGFPEHLGRRKKLPLSQEEFFLNQELRNIGYDLVYIPKLEVKHYIPDSRIYEKYFILDSFWHGVSKKLQVYDSIEIAEIEHFIELMSQFLELKLNQYSNTDDYEIIINTLKSFERLGSAFAEEFFSNHSKHDICLSDNLPVIYVVTPSFNSEKFINNTILSVVSQEGNFSIRYHIQDGGSTDGTLHILKKWKELFEENLFPISCNNVIFTYSSNKDKGMYDAILNGFRSMSISDNSFMTWINSDDTVANHAFALIHKIQSEFSPNEVSWITGQASIVYDNIVVKNDTRCYCQELLMNGVCDGEHWFFVQQEGTFFRHWLWKATQDTSAIASFRYAGDWNLWRNFAKYTHLITTNIPLAYFRKNENQLSTDLSQYLEEINNIISREERASAFKKIAENYDLFEKSLKVDYPNYSLKIENKSIFGQAQYFYNHIFGHFIKKQIKNNKNNDKQNKLWQNTKTSRRSLFVILLATGDADQINESLKSLILKDVLYNTTIIIQKLHECNELNTIFNNWTNFLAENIQSSDSKISLMMNDCTCFEQHEALINGLNNLEIKDSDLITWMPPGCVINENFIYIVKEFINNSHLDWFTTNLYAFDKLSEDIAKGYILPSSIIKNGLLDNVHLPALTQPGVFFSKSLLLKSNHLVKTNHITWEWNLWKTFAEFSDLSVINFDIFMQSNQNTLDNIELDYDFINSHIAPNLRTNFYNKILSYLHFVRNIHTI